jgi:hypothetical protein
MKESKITVLATAKRDLFDFAKLVLKGMTAKPTVHRLKLAGFDRLQFAH